MSRRRRCLMRRALRDQERDVNTLATDTTDRSTPEAWREVWSAELAQRGVR